MVDTVPTTYNPEDNTISGNVIRGAEIGISEALGATRNYGTNRMIGVTTPYFPYGDGLSQSRFEVAGE